MQEITSRKNPMLQHLKKLGTDKTYRTETGEFLCDGPTLYREAVAAGMEITFFITSKRDFMVQSTHPAVWVPDDVLASISPQKSPQGVLFACKIPMHPPAKSPRTTLVLDGVQDPGNVGTLVRTALAFGADQVILLRETADVYNPKTIRAGMGAIFRQPITRMTTSELADYLAENNLTMLGANLAASSQPATSPMPERVAIAIGSEGAGLSDEIQNLCDATIYIPMRPGVESLNAAVAGSVLMWERHRSIYKN